MQVSVETTGGLGRRMTVQIPAEQIDQQVESRLQQLSRTVRIDGFRPGKVPISVVEKRYGEQVREEATGELIASTYEQALQQENLQPAGEPSIEQTRNQQGEELEYVASFEVYPEIDPPDLSDLVIERPVAEVTDADVDEMFDKLRRQRITWNQVDRPAQNGDRLEIDFEGTVEGSAFQGNSGQNVPVELGSGAMIPGFEEQLSGSSAGGTTRVEVTFPEDYPSSEVAGKQAVFEVKVNTVSEPVLPEVNEEFARAFGITDGGVERLRSEVRSNMQRELDAVLRSSVKKQVFDELMSKASIEVPGKLVESEIEALARQQSDATSEQKSREQLEQEARRRVSLGLMIAEIIKQNQLQVDPEQVRQHIENLARSYENPDEVVQWYYSNQEMLMNVQTLATEEMVVDWITQQAKTEDKLTTFSEIMQA